MHLYLYLTVDCFETFSDKQNAQMVYPINKQY